MTRRRPSEDYREIVASRCRSILIAAGLVVVAAGANAPPALAEPPANDAYAKAIALNAPGSEMPRDTVTTAATDTTDATVQSDLFNPPAAGGPPEPTTCAPATEPFGRTIWYSFFPEADGKVTIQAIGFDTTVGLVTFASAANPLPQGYSCANKRDDSIETLTANVEGGSSYNVQIGGTGGIAGVVQVSFTYLPDRDSDGVTDDNDRCPTRAGTVNGCPPAITTRVPYTFGGRPGGVKLTTVRVQGAPSGSRIAVRCSPGCGRIRLAYRSPITPIAALAGRFMRNGTKIEVRVTKDGYIGDYARLTVANKDITVLHRCMQPGSTVPRVRCS